MPLHAEHESPVWKLDRLRQIVACRDPAHRQALPQPIDALVVAGVVYYGLSKAWVYFSPVASSVEAMPEQV